jgi:hypothetical protein
LLYPSNRAPEVRTPMKFTEAQLESAIIELLEAEGGEPNGFE